MQVESGGTVDFQGDSLTLATGGQVGVKAGKRTLVRDGAQIDVSGAIGVAVSMESNNLKINVQGNEQRDAPMNRDSGKLNNGDIWLDRRELIRVASGSGGYDGDRWYSGGGLLEVGGYLGTMGVPVSHWLAQGGQVRFEGAEVVTQKGSSINLSGGTLDVRAGTLQQTWLRGGRSPVRGRQGPGDVLYTGVYQGYDSVPRAGAKGHAPLLQPAAGAAHPLRGRLHGRPRRRHAAHLDPQRRAGRRSGRRHLPGHAPGPRAAVRAGRLQPVAAPPPRRAGLVVGNDVRYYDTASRQIYSQLAPPATRWPKWCWARDARVADGLDLGAALPQENKGKLFLDANQLNGFAGPAARRGRTFHHRRCGLARRRWRRNHAVCAGRGRQGQSDQPWRPDPGRQRCINLFLAVRLEDSALAPAANQKARLHVSGGVMLDARGVWANLLGRRRPGRPAGARRRPHRCAAPVTWRGRGQRAGRDRWRLAGVRWQAARRQGRHVTLASHVLGQIPSNGGLLSFAGEVRGYGVTGRPPPCARRRSLRAALGAQDASCGWTAFALASVYDQRLLRPDRRGRRADRRCHAAAGPDSFQRRLLSFAGEVRGYGVSGGTLSVASGGKIVLGGLDAQDATTLRLDLSLFSTGFGKYEINGCGPGPSRTARRSTCSCRCCG